MKKNIKFVLIILIQSFLFLEVAFANIILTDTTNLSLAAIQTESGPNISENPSVINGPVGESIPFSETTATYLSGVYGVSNLNDGDISTGNPSDGTYAIPITNILTLDFGNIQPIGSIAIYYGYGNRDDGTYTLKNGIGAILGAWTISDTTSASNDGVESIWLKFNAVVLTDKLILEFVPNEPTTSTTSFREIIAYQETNAHFILTDTTNLTVINSQIESGGNTSDNPNVVNGATGLLIPYTETTASYLDATHGISNLNDGDIGIGIPSDGTYAIPIAGSLTLDFEATRAIDSIAVYHGYGNRDDGDYILKDSANNIIGAWTISGTDSFSNDGVDSLWLKFNTPVSTDKLILDYIPNELETSTISFREIAVFGKKFVTLTDTTNLKLENSQIELGNDNSENPNVLNGTVGNVIPYTESNASYLNETYGSNNLNDNDIGIGISSDGSYAIPTTGSLILNFDEPHVVGSIAIYSGYSNRDDGNYILKDDSDNVLGAWTISGTEGGTNEGTYSLWFEFKTEVSTSRLILDYASNEIDTSTVSFREIVVYSKEQSPVSGLIAHWPLDEGNGSAITDLSGNGANGTLAGNNWQWIENEGNDLLYLCHDDHINIAPTNVNIVDNFTIANWINTSKTISHEVFLSKGPKDSGHFELYLSATGEWRTYIPDFGSKSDLGSGSIIDDGVWRHIAVTYDGSLMRFYENGILIKTEAVTGAIADKTETIRIGGLVDGSFGFRGSVRDIRVYDHLLSDAGINALYTASSVPPAVSAFCPSQSLDELEKAAYQAGPTPFDSTADSVQLNSGAISHPNGPITFSLDGTWEMAEDEFFTTSIPAMVPGSVIKSLWDAGNLENPYVGLNEITAELESRKTWWFKTTFDRPLGITDETLHFGGIALDSTIWLNGNLLGTHSGMFGEMEYDVSSLLQASNNTLIVKIDPVPRRISTGEPNSFFNGMNVGWLDTVTFNNNWGWHYSNMPSQGIWRSVTLSGRPEVQIKNPFIKVTSINGDLELVTKLVNSTSNWSGTLRGTIEPDNFSGNSYHFSYVVNSMESEKNLHLQFTHPEPKLWWPNGHGDPNLYKVKLSFEPNNGISDYTEIPLGIRTIEWTGINEEIFPNFYNWQLVINGKPIFIKGTGWCTADTLMDFTYERYERFITMAKDQNMQMLRAWGSGMPETDEFYDLANRHGIMVLQEWPTAWNSHLYQPYDLLEETVRQNTFRIRNNPSLVMYGGGNESGNPVGEAIDMMGRYSIELDSTRPFHKGEPWGGSKHDYSVWWGRSDLSYNLKLTAPFIGEFGVASSPIYESVQRYLPNNEPEWPPTASYEYHTPVFNRKEDMSRLQQYSGYFLPYDSIENISFGSQLAQTVGIRHPMEFNRTRWPQHSAGILTYKLNDNYPAVSWATVDWYGAPKMAHYFSQDAFTPLHAIAEYSSLQHMGLELTLPIHIIDDNDDLAGTTWWRVKVSAYDGALDLIKTDNYDDSDGGSINYKSHLGDFTLTATQTQSNPLLVVVEISVDTAANVVDRTFYWSNYNATTGNLLELPGTTLTTTVVNSTTIQVTNTGSKPAVGVELIQAGHMDTFTASDGHFWLNPGESKNIIVSTTSGVTVTSWNNP